jgi:hypothetical protein
LSSAIQSKHTCQETQSIMMNGQAKAGGSERSRKRKQAQGRADVQTAANKIKNPDQKTRITAKTSNDLYIGNESKAYRLKGSRTFNKYKSGKQLQSWLEIAKEMFSTSSKKERGENVSVPSVDGCDGTNYRASHVTDGKRPARSLRGGIDKSVHVRSGFTLLDYRNTQAESRQKIHKEYFSKKNEHDLYKYKTIRSGDVLESYEYEGLQISRKGRKKKESKKEDENIEEKTEEQIHEIRKKSISSKQAYKKVYKPKSCIRTFKRWRC